MEKLVDVIAPTNLTNFLVKSFILVSVYTATHVTVTQAVATRVDDTLHMQVLLTFLIGAPFSLFVMSIMSVQRRLKSRLRRLAETDALTGLRNRAQFLKVAATHLGGDQPVAALMIDLDHFKAINDRYGHYVGDLTLQQVARHLQTSVRASDIVGRLGGEEFAVVLPNTTVETAQHVAKRICRPVRVQITDADGKPQGALEVTMSVGGVMNLPGKSLIDLLKQADDAMYQAKHSGRARVVFYDSTSPTQLAG
ncbi:GGDEF domain-containing protein [Thalassorhabdomicrobium marinisediminis]|uniref:GGDEF domain-containing protein n=1 Tax=Thalassorhabdomicrobium marinisediminis TaxID=2170577 RepID=UPI0024911A2B|nr:GGDEF domain-containing protein [Thalassorhabdomicrobium marinisediminis]